MVVDGELEGLFNVSVGSGESLKHFSDVSSLLHRDDSELIFLVEPDQEGLVVIVEDSFNLFYKNNKINTIETKVIQSQTLNNSKTLQKIARYIYTTPQMNRILLTSTIRPISVKTSSLKVFIALRKQEVVVSQLLCLLSAHLAERIVLSLKVSLKGFEGLDGLAFEFPSLFL